MTDKIAFDLVSPERLLLSEEAEMVTIPGTEGDMGVMEGHMPLISTLRTGVIDVKGFHVIGGFAEVTPEKLTVLAEEAVPVSEMTAASLEVRIKHAEEDFSLAKSDVERAKALERLEYFRALHATI